LRVGPAAADGRIEVEIAAPDSNTFVRRMAGFGMLVEVIEPAEVRAGLALIGAELVSLYDAR
jgi:predicted DNA-binding transcriptional regulator YafY